MNFNKRWRSYALFLLLLIFLAVEAPIIAAGWLSRPVPGDVMIVLGAKLIGDQPSAILRLRLDEAVSLYRRGYAPNIIVSGAKGEDEKISEAEAMRNYLVQQGIPPECIHLEAASFNTYQNLANSKIIMERLGYRQAVIVSSASHIRRAVALAQTLGMEVSAAPAPMAANNPYLTVKQYLREGAAIVYLAFTGR